MLLMTEKGIRGAICHVVDKYEKGNNKYIKIYCNNIESSYLMYLDGNNLYGSRMSHTLSVNSFKWKKSS